MKAAVFISHGSRTDEGNKQFITFIRQVLDRTPLPIVVYGFLENARPTVMEAVENCIRRGATEILVIPVLLLPGIHANLDIPQILEKAQQKHPGIGILYGKPLGINGIMVDIIEERLRSKGYTGSRDEAILLVGHGSRDPQAAVEFETLAGIMRRKTAARVETAYITTSPFYAGKCSQLLSSQVRKVYLLPYLLFTGGFAVKMEENAQEISRLNPRNEVIVCEPVGFDGRLQELLVNRAVEAGIL